MQNAVGIVEIIGSANAIFVVDKMLKTANVSYVSKETVFGLGRVTVFVQGNVASVTEAINTLSSSTECEIFAKYVIANPHFETQRFLEKSMLNSRGIMK